MITAIRIINVTIIIKMVRVHKVYTENENGKNNNNNNK